MSKLSADVFIGLGGNLGDTRVIFERAIAKIGETAEVTGVSSLYRSKPFGYESQADFRNAVIQVTTETPALPLLDKLQAIEVELGKKIVRENGPRTIDLDLLFHGATEIKNKQLEIPHPGIPERDFVLLPLAEVDPDFRHPTLKKSVAELVSKLAKTYVMDFEDFNPRLEE